MTVVSICRNIPIACLYPFIIITYFSSVTVIRFSVGNYASTHIKDYQLLRVQFKLSKLCSKDTRLASLLSRGTRPEYDIPSWWSWSPKLHWGATLLGQWPTTVVPLKEEHLERCTVHNIIWAPVQFCHLKAI